MVKLKSSKFIGQGTNRKCYVDPRDDSKCIKITFSGDKSESYKERKYYLLLEKRKVSWKMIAKYYETVETDMGEGLVFDLIRDFDGNISKTLEEYMLTEESISNISNPINLLHKLKEYQLKENIIIKDLNTKNIMYRKISDIEGELVAIDGVYNNDFLPFSSYIDFFTKRKILRRWKKFEDSLSINKKFKDNKLFIQMLKENPF